MTNRIGRYLGKLEDINRAADTLRFCDALVCLHADFREMSSWEVKAISDLQTDAVRIFRELDVPLPWATVESQRLASKRRGAIPAWLARWPTSSSQDEN
jgi:hypothetical protein